MGYGAFQQGGVQFFHWLCLGENTPEPQGLVFSIRDGGVLGNGDLPDKILGRFLINGLVFQQGLQFLFQLDDCLFPAAVG